MYDLTPTTVRKVAGQVASEVVATGQSKGWAPLSGQSAITQVLMRDLTNTLTTFNISYDESTCAWIPGQRPATSPRSLEDLEGFFTGHTPVGERCVHITFESETAFVVDIFDTVAAATDGDEGVTVGAPIFVDLVRGWAAAEPQMRVMPAGSSNYPPPRRVHGDFLNERVFYLVFLAGTPVDGRPILIDTQTGQLVTEPAQK
jgi:hypothetical protein